MTGEDLLLGIDIGTTRTKALLVDRTGATDRLTTVPTPFHIVPEGVEMGMADLESALAAVLAALPAEARRAVVAVGIAGLAESGVPLAGGQPIAPIIAWHDGRGEETARRLSTRFGADLVNWIGQRARSVSSVAKLGWLVERGLGAFDRWLGVPELGLWFLTGEEATDWSLAARTGALHIARREWMPDILDAAGIPPGVFPRPRPAGEVMGTLSPAAAGRYGLPAGVPVTLGGHDHLAAVEGLALGPGSTTAGGPDPVAYNSVGTAESVIRRCPTLPDLERAVELRLAVTLRPGGHGWAVLAGAARPGLVLGPLAERLGQTPAELDALPRSDPMGAEWARELRTLAARTAEAAGRLTTLLGRAEQVIAFGGGSRSRPWMLAKADLLAPTPLLRAIVPEAAARGAALAAGTAAGWWPEPAEGPPAPLDTDIL